MKHVDLRIDARWIVPIAPAGVLDEHALLATAGRIVAIVAGLRSAVAGVV